MNLETETFFVEVLLLFFAIIVFAILVIGLYYAGKSFKHLEE